MPCPAWAGRSDGAVDWMNGALCTVTGASPDELMAGGIAAVVHPDEHARLAETLARAASPAGDFGIGASGLQVRLRFAAGGHRWHLLRLAPAVGSAQGASVQGVPAQVAPADMAADMVAGVAVDCAVALIGTATDIDAQVVAVESLARDNEELERDVFRQLHELNRNRSRLQTIFDTCPDILYLLRLSRDGGLVFEDANKAADLLFSTESGALLGQSVGTLPAVEGFDSILSHARQALRGDAVDYVVEGRVPPRTPVVVQVVGVAVDYSNEEEGLVLFCGRDITRQRAAEEALRQSQKMEAVGQLTGGLAHDFNNLLTGIMGSLDLLETRLGQGRYDRVERYVRTAQEAAKRAASLTHRLLAFSRQQTLDPKPSDVNALVAGMEDLLRRTVGPEISLDVVREPGLWTVLVDVSQLENALLNLCINARDAMANGGRIIVDTRNSRLSPRDAGERDLPPGDYVALSVTDNGSGMPPEVAARIFEPFFTTKPMGSGTGLGLSMIYGFARQSGGNVRVHTRPGLGTTMRIVLPRHHGKAEPDAERAAPETVPRAKAGESVLVIDDEYAVRSLTGEILDELGYRTAAAANGRDGLKLLRSADRYDLLVTDVGMPGGLNGRQVAEAARKLRPDLKILFITGYAEGAVLTDGQMANGAQVLTKPFAMETLAVRVRQLIDER